MNNRKYIRKLEKKHNIKLLPTFTPGEDGYSKKRIKEFKKYIKHHGFDYRETYDLEYYMALNLYERMMAFMEKAPNIVDYTFYKFDVPVLVKHTKEEREIKKRYFYQECKNMTQLDAMNLMIKYLRKGLVCYSKSGKWSDEKYYEYIEAAFQMFTIMLPAMWW